MADAKIGRAVLELTIDNKQFKLGLEETSKSSEKTAKSVKKIGSALDVAAFALFAKTAIAAITSVGGAIIDLGKRGAAVGDVQAAFGALTGKINETSDAMLGKLREGVKGTLSDYDLMALANKALGAGLIKNSDDMGVLAASARGLAKATGGDTKEAFDRLTTAMASGRTASLKQLGLFVDSKKSIEAYAESIGKTVSQLTDEDRAQALAAASLEAMRTRLGEIPPQARDFGEILEAARVAVLNFRDELSVAVSESPVFIGGMNALGESMAEVFGPRQGDAIKFIVRLLEDVTIAALRIASPMLTVAEVVGVAFQSAKIALNAVLEAIYSGIGKVTGFLADLYEKASALPGIGEKFAAGAKELRGMADMADSAAYNFGALKDEQIATALAIQDNLGRARTVVDAFAKGMLDARAAADASAGGIKTSLATIGAAGEEAAERDKQNTEKIADVHRKLEQELALIGRVGLDRRLIELSQQEANEIAALGKLKQVTASEYTELVTMVEEKYARLRSAAQTTKDEISSRFSELQNEVALGYMTGTERVVAEIEMRKAKELEGLEYLRALYPVVYENLRALVDEKYRQMTAAATGYYSTTEQAATAAGFKTRDELEETAKRAQDLYAAMLESGKYTHAELQKAHEAAKKAEAEIEGKAYTSKKDILSNLASDTSTFLRTMFGKSKAAAIAAAIIDTYASVAKALAAYPWPWSLIPAAMALAMGMKQVNEIRNAKAEGFATGTPGLDFANFGAVTPTALHGQEAVIPRGGGHILAGEIASALGSGKGNGSDAARLALAIERLPDTLRRALRYSSLQARR